MSPKMRHAPARSAKMLRRSNRVKTGSERRFILVFAASPGRVASELVVPFPHPRNRLDPAFRQLVDDIYGLMTRRPVPPLEAIPGDWAIAPLVAHGPAEAGAAADALRPPLSPGHTRGERLGVASGGPGGRHGCGFNCGGIDGWWHQLLPAGQFPEDYLASNPDWQFGAKAGTAVVRPPARD